MSIRWIAAALVANADSFRNQRSEVDTAYVDGFQSGLPDELR
jgi:hypothetical protein